ncbi:MAG: C39 family peptidase [Candidatus Parcubacteria bacterium]|nr:C39 family peptidase [Candidatus Parcubacteria bacterium]
MKNIFKFIIIVLVVLVGGYFLLSAILDDAPLEANSSGNSTNAATVKSVNNAVTQNVNVNKPININQPVVTPVVNVSKVLLSVPYINESPDNSWTGPWKNACEEACITMVDKYYYGRSTVSVLEAEKMMTELFNAQNKLWGGNANSDAVRTAKLINDNTIYNATIIEKPTISQIKKELQQNRPVIVPVYGFDLQNKNIPFVPAPRGTSYHMLVIIGYDDATKEFITNDSGDTKDGPNHRYGYDLLMNAIHDYSFVTKHADGPARAIFTYPKLVKLANSPRVYYLHELIQQYIPSETIFKAKGWSWDAVNVVNQEWLDTFVKGEDLK